jgi:integrase/recombinase XerD
VNSLRQSVSDYLAMRRSLGFKLQKAGRALLEFVSFLEQHRASYITLQLALEWAKAPYGGEPGAWPAQRLSFVRGFARYRSAIDPRTQVPPPRLMPFPPQRARPYLYSDAEISQLLRAALNIQATFPRQHRKLCALLPWVYYCLFGLLSVSGLRVSEACNLKLEDVDLKDGVLTVRSGKFGQDRLVPLHPSTRKVVAEYLNRRQRHWAGRTVSSYLFVSSFGNRLSPGGIRRVFYALSRRIGLRGVSASHGPRLHDFRHRFASETLWRWHRKGQEPERRLPILSAFLGHINWKDTFWYLSATPELMHGAMRRLERHWRQRLWPS